MPSGITKKPKAQWKSEYGKGKRSSADNEIVEVVDLEASEPAKKKLAVKNFAKKTANEENSMPPVAHQSSKPPKKGQNS